MLKKWQLKALEKMTGWLEFANEESSSAINKKLLLEMAKRGEPRPSKRSDKLGLALCNYTNPNHECYDLEFDRQIRDLRENWFIDVVAENKKLLLEMAKRGESRPSQKVKLGRTLCNYTNPKNGCYDPEFDKQIRKLAPHWFVDTAEENKRLLLEMAKRGEPRPSKRGNKLGEALVSYTNIKQKCYDPEFDKQIRKLASHWFVDTAEENKKLLLEMARRGDPRPNAKTKLGQALINYTNNRSYDPEFDKQIRKLAPHWFVDTAEENKKLLLEMARRGEPRPKQRESKIGLALCNYTNPKTGSYDPEFDKQIRKLAPHWFRKA
jgi:hypothetical protein